MFIAGAPEFPKGGILEGGFGIQSEGPQAIEGHAFLAKEGEFLFEVAVAS